ncbi:MAG: ABC transporter ATP-binding protein [Actinomycetota bacterium]|jgi:iron(III) transport system ATP-binding protein|nr:ABC transporter ATP-binding protein [Actinomycetota bacterium]
MSTLSDSTTARVDVARDVAPVVRATSTAIAHPSRIVVDDVEKAYGEHRVLDGIHLNIEPGQFTVLLGPSGSGKSTLLRCVGGLEKIDDGHIRFGEQTMNSAKVHVAPERRNVSMVFQDFALWPHMSIFDNVAFSLHKPGVAKDERRRAVGEILERVGLADFATRYPSTLSGGQQQRVSLARALVGAPAMILFDEPLSSLDAHLRERLRIEIADLTREAGSSVLYITHDQVEAFALADVIGVLNEGELVQVASPEEIYRNPATPFVARFTGVAGELDGDVVRRESDGRVLVRCADGLVHARLSGATSQSDPRVRVFVRAAPLRISAADAEARAEHSCLAGRVVDAAFRGRGYEHVIELDGGERLLGVFSEERWNRHENITLHVPGDACIAFARE